MTRFVVAGCQLVSLRMEGEDLDRLKCLSGTIILNYSLPPLLLSVVIRSIAFWVMELFDTYSAMLSSMLL